MYAHAAVLLLQQVLKTAVTVMQWQNTKLHAQMRTATLLQWQDTKLHARGGCYCIFYR
jgi:hypothetical protein